MLHLRASKIAVLLPLFLSPVLAKDANLVGCDEVSCPKEGPYDRCTVEDNTFLGVGLSNIANLPSELEGFSLVKGVNVSQGLAGKDNDKPTRPFKSVYYLATPENTRTSEFPGCAVIFNNPPDKKFKGPELRGDTNATDTRAATGTCTDVLEQTCIDTITERARKVVQDSNSNVCENLEEELKKDSFNGCDGFGGQGTSLGDFTIKSFGVLDLMKNSSDCWPVQEKSDQLMQISEVNSHANYSASALIQEAYKITPILTVFIGGNDTLVDRASSQMTCLKVVTTEDPSDDDDSSDNSAVALNKGWLAVTIPAFVGSFLAL
ncbi:hypothetical protein N7508_001038 [Penicillium antarcticum]|uniref:uncharacterized protein n=1 Tax=Penicillium antarcticum TaxID=416450 RepID=UPI0023858378|nr:uncharacterized protein N7508_001038 [Penicillium antarcticum]KAJ5316530.1 hypothetical protein N7508_001038 [Penicillium antarcticum]